MKLSSLIKEDALILNLKSRSKEGAINEIIENLTDDKEKQEEIRNAIFEREKIGSTLLEGTGVAVPHAREKSLTDFYVAVGLSKEGIEGENNQGKIEKAHVFILIAAHPLKNKIMLNILSSLAKVLKNQPDFAVRLASSESEEQARSTLEKIKTSSTLDLGHLMTREYLSLSQRSTLKEAVTFMVDQNLFYIPVVDEKGKFVGEVTDRDILLFAVPDYILQMDNLRFVVEDEPFERFLLQESKILVEEVMNTKPLCIDHDSSIIEAVSLMLKHNKRYLYVLEDKKLIGILSQKDVLRKILFV